MLFSWTALNFSYNPFIMAVGLLLGSRSMYYENPLTPSLSIADQLSQLFLDKDMSIPSCHGSCFEKEPPFFSFFSKTSVKFY
jgi:hypothetical protein